MTEGEYAYTAVGQATTDRHGEFDFGPINADLGKYKVWVIADKEQASTTATVTDLEKPLTIKLKRGLIIEGYLINDDTDQPIADAEVYAMLPDFQPGAIFSYEAEAKTDAKGYFKFTNLNDEEYKLNTRVSYGRAVDNDSFFPGEKDIELRITTEQR